MTAEPPGRPDAAEPAPDSGRRFRGGPPWRGGPPPWWPASEPWPPPGRESWQGVPRHFARRVAMFLLALFGLAFLAGGFLFWIGSNVWHGNATHRWNGARPFGFIVVLVILVLAVVAIRGARRTTRPVAEVMGAADRVASGDYSARVSPSGPGEVRNLARSFNAMAERLESNERVRRQLFADVAHELRTPLTIIQANIEGILDGLYAADAEHLEPALEETRVMARLLEDLSTLAMAESGALRLQIEPTDPNELVEDVVAAHRPEATAAGVGLTAAASPSLGPVDMDAVRIREVLSNLIANAIRYTPDGGRITAAAEANPGGGVRFSVTDSGAGIPSERLERVFDRFSKSPDSRGSGLGLAIAKSLVEAHDGTIGVRSGAGAGTTFWFVIPRIRGLGTH
jgi:two-component system, OmpR family, sensor histidine kinase BaeS